MPSKMSRHAEFPTRLPRPTNIPASGSRTRKSCVTSSVSAPCCSWRVSRMCAIPAQRIRFIEQSAQSPAYRPVRMCGLLGLLADKRRMKPHSVHFLVPILLFFSIAASSQTPTSAPIRSEQEKRAYLKAMEEADQKIAAEVKAHSELIKNLEYLTTRIGARLTGSPQMQAASEWTVKRFRDYGIDAHLETAQIPHSWTRGSDSAEITSPVARKIEIRSMGWSVATNGPVQRTTQGSDSIRRQADRTAFRSRDARECIRCGDRTFSWNSQTASFMA